MLESTKFLDVDLATWKLGDVDLIDTAVVYGLSLRQAPANSDFHHNWEIQLQFRLFEIRAFKEKWRKIAAENNFEYSGYEFKRMLRNKEKALERERLLNALLEALELVQALNQLKTFLNLNEDTPDSEMKTSVTEFFLEAEQLAYNFLAKEKLEIHPPGIKSERALLTDVLNKTTAAYREPLNLQHIRDLAESGNALPAYKLGWKSFVVKHRLVVTVAIVICVTLVTIAIGLGVGHACIAVGLSFIAQLIVQGITTLIASYVNNKLGHQVIISARKRSDQELFQDTELKTKTSTMVSALRKHSLYPIPQMEVAEVTPVINITRAII